MDEKEVETQNNTLAIEIPNEIPSETKDDIFDNIKEHKKSIDRMFVSQYMNEEYDSDDYVVTYSRKDKSVLGWSVNVEKNGPQQPDVYFKVDIDDDLYRFGEPSVLLSKKILIWSFYLYDFSSDQKFCKYLF